ncbi:MAG: NAD-dependent epimerase/dehydratase family protein [Oligoflexia bacterium]|nr:NAD-dependent epimerase/dehydratase family protein [Oligoflexia bacterium]
MLCLVTGAAGFIGSTLCERLLRDGHTVRAIDSFVEYYPRALKEQNLSLALKQPGFQFLEGDLAASNLKDLLKDVEVVFHQAAQAGVRASWGRYFQSYTHNNITATQALLEGCQGLKHLRKFIFASSSSVYGNAETAPTSERVIPAPVSPYGVTKLASEHMVTLYAKEAAVPTVALRYFTVFGPRQRPDMAFNRFIRSALQREAIVVYGDGTQSRDFTYIDDIIEANLLAAEKGAPGEVFNVGGGPHASVNEVLKILDAELGQLDVKYEERQRGDARHTYADISLAKHKLGFTPKTTLADGLRAEIAWLKSSLGA